MKKLLILLLLLFIPYFGFSQGIKVSALPETTSLGDSDLFLVIQGSTTKKVQFYRFSYNSEKTAYQIADSLYNFLRRSDSSNYITVTRLTDSLNYYSSISSLVDSLAKYTTLIALQDSLLVYEWNVDSTARVVRDSLTNYTKLSYLSSQLDTKQGLDATLTALAGLTITESSLIYGTAADAFSVLPKGTAGQALKMNAGATAPEWAIVGGTPAGNNREIQFNNNGVFGADANFKWTGKRLDLKSSVGTGNVFIGDSSGRITTGDYNSFLGYESGYSNTTGYYNIFNGCHAGYSNTTGYYNTFLGTDAGYYNTTGVQNTFLSAFAGYYNTTGSQNLFSGVQSGYSNTTGYDNLFSGVLSGYRNTTGSYNLFSGNNSGYSNTTGSSNVFLGFKSGYYETGSNKLFIDNQSRTDEATSRISSLIYGEFHATPASQLLRINGQFQLPVISTGTGTHSLYWNSNTGAVTYGAVPVSSQWTTIGSDIYYANKVMIGSTSAPTNILSLGNSAAQKFWIENSATDVVGRALTVSAGGTVAGTSVSDVVGGNLILQAGLGTGTGASTISFQTGTTLTTGLTLQTMSTKMVILGNGNVGIGTTIPGYKLDVNGDAYFKDPIIINSNIKIHRGVGNENNSFSAGGIANLSKITPGVPAAANGTYNTAVGQNVLTEVTTGSDNTGFGSNALTNNISGFGNTAVGHLTLAASTASSFNTAIGNFAAKNYDIAGENVFVGALAGENANTLAGSNVLIGYKSGIRINGTYNTFVGHRTGELTTTGARNTFLGRNAGYDVTTGSDNIFIGNEVRGVTTGSNNIIIGGNINSIGTLNDNIILANGTGAIKAQNDGTNWTLSGNIGIGTTAPTEKLDVNSDKIRLRTAKTPASATATGNAGDICWDASYIYVCVATDSWKRVAIAAW